MGRGNKKTFFSLFKRAVALLVAVSVSLPANTAQAAGRPPAPAAAEVITPVPFSHITIPAEFGKIKEKFEGRGDQTVFLIQDAHSISDAQQSIEKLIEFAQKKYGVSLVGVEGAASALDPQIFKSFPDKDRLKKVLGGYFESGELTGGNAAAIFSSQKADYQGVEDWQLYEEGVGLYLAAMERESELSSKLKVQSSKLEEKKKEVYSKELLELDGKLEKFFRGELDLVSAGKALIKTQSTVRGPRSIVKAKEIEAFLQEIQNSDTSHLAAEVERIAEAIKRSMEKSESSTVDRGLLTQFNAQYQSYRTSQITPQAFALFLKEFAAKNGLKIKFSSALLGGVKHQKTLRDLEGTKFLKEFEAYAKAVKESLMTSDEQKKLDAESREILLLEKLVKLELSREEWEEVKLQRGKGEGERGEKPFALSPMLSAQYAFYENAEKRDEALLGNLLKGLGSRKGEIRSEKGEGIVKGTGVSGDGSNGVQDILIPRHTNTPLPVHPESFSTQSAILVAGGFHAQGITRQLREKNISYVLVMPEIKNIPKGKDSEGSPRANYREHMKGNVSWKKYFEVKDGKVNLYEAFVRGTRDRLIANSVERRADSNAYPLLAARYTLKNWRDQIIRDLAAQGRIEKAGEYTRFIDELVHSPQSIDHGPLTIDHRLITAWRANVNRFISGLRGLKETNQLSEANIAKLLISSKAGVGAPATSAALAVGSGSGLRADLIVPRSESRKSRLESVESKKVPDFLGNQVKAHSDKISAGNVYRVLGVRWFSRLTRPLQSKWGFTLRGSSRESKYQSFSDFLKQKEKIHWASFLLLSFPMFVFLFANPAVGITLFIFNALANGYPLLMHRYKQSILARRQSRIQKTIVDSQRFQLAQLGKPTGEENSKATGDGETQKRSEQRNQHDELKDPVLRNLPQETQGKIQTAVGFLTQVLHVANHKYDGTNSQAAGGGLDSGAVMRFFITLAGSDHEWDMNRFSEGWALKALEYLSENHPQFQDGKLNVQLRFRIEMEMYARFLNHEIEFDTKDAEMVNEVQTAIDHLFSKQAGLEEERFREMEKKIHLWENRSALQAFGALDRIALYAEKPEGEEARIAADFLAYFAKRFFERKETQQMFLMNKAVIEAQFEHERQSNAKQELVFLGSGSNLLAAQAQEIARVKGMDENRIRILYLNRRILQKNAELLPEYISSLPDSKRFFIFDTGFRGSLIKVVRDILKSQRPASVDTFGRLLVLTPHQPWAKAPELMGWNQVVSGGADKTSMKEMSRAALYLDQVFPKKYESPTRLVRAPDGLVVPVLRLTDTPRFSGIVARELNHATRELLANETVSPLGKKKELSLFVSGNLPQQKKSRSVTPKAGENLSQMHREVFRSGIHKWSPLDPSTGNRLKLSLYNFAVGIRSILFSMEVQAAGFFSAAVAGFYYLIRPTNSEDAIVFWSFAAAIFFGALVIVLPLIHLKRAIDSVTRGPVDLLGVRRFFGYRGVKELEIVPGWLLAQVRRSNPDFPDGKQGSALLVERFKKYSQLLSTFKKDSSGRNLLPSEIDLLRYLAVSGKESLEKTFWFALTTGLARDYAKDDSYGKGSRLSFAKRREYLAAQQWEEKDWASYTLAALLRFGFIIKARTAPGSWEIDPNDPSPFPMEQTGLSNWGLQGQDLSLEGMKKSLQWTVIRDPQTKKEQVFPSWAVKQVWEPVFDWASAVIVKMASEEPSPEKIESLIDFMRESSFLFDSDAAAGENRSENRVEVSAEDLNLSNSSVLRALFYHSIFFPWKGKRVFEAPLMSTDHRILRFFERGFAPLSALILAVIRFFHFGSGIGKFEITNHHRILSEFADTVFSDTQKYNENPSAVEWDEHRLEIARKFEARSGWKIKAHSNPYLLAYPDAKSKTVWLGAGWFIKAPDRDHLSGYLIQVLEDIETAIQQTGAAQQRSEPRAVSEESLEVRSEIRDRKKEIYSEEERALKFLMQTSLREGVPFTLEQLQETLSKVKQLAGREEDVREGIDEISDFDPSAVLEKMDQKEWVSVIDGGKGKRYKITAAGILDYNRLWHPLSDSRGSGIQAELQRELSESKLSDELKGKWKVFLNRYGWDVLLDLSATIPWDFFKKDSFKSRKAKSNFEVVIPEIFAFLIRKALSGNKDSAWLAASSYFDFVKRWSNFKNTSENIQKTLGELYELYQTEPVSDLKDAMLEKTLPDFLRLAGKNTAELWPVWLELLKAHTGKGYYIARDLLRAFTEEEHRIFEEAEVSTKFSDLVRLGLKPDVRSTLYAQIIPALKSDIEKAGLQFRDYWPGLKELGLRSQGSLTQFYFYQLHHGGIKPFLGRAGLEKWESALVRSRESSGSVEEFYAEIARQVNDPQMSFEDFQRILSQIVFRGTSGAAAQPTVKVEGEPQTERAKEFLRLMSKGEKRVLIIHNVEEGIGDELIRNGMLIQALLELNPDLCIDIVTRRFFIYHHPRIRTGRRLDHVAERGKKYDMVIDREPGRDKQPLEADLLGKGISFMENVPVFIRSEGGYDHVKYTDIRVGKIPLTALQPKENYYAITRDLLDALGLKPPTNFRSGKAGNFMTGESSEKSYTDAWHARKWWEINIPKEYRGQKESRQPVAYVNLFGGEAEGKGFRNKEAAEAVHQLTLLIRAGFFVVLQPPSSNAPWFLFRGDPEKYVKETFLKQMPLDDRAQIVLAPRLNSMDPIHNYLMTFADLTGTVEGGISHVAWHLGVPFVSAGFLDYSDWGGDGHYTALEYWMPPFSSRDSFDDKEWGQGGNLTNQEFWKPPLNLTAQRYFDNKRVLAQEMIRLAQDLKLNGVVPDSAIEESGTENPSIFRGVGRQRQQSGRGAAKNEAGGEETQQRSEVREPQDVLQNKGDKIPRLVRQGVGPKIKNGDRVLEMGIGSGVLTRELQEALKHLKGVQYFGFDANPEAVTKSKNLLGESADIRESNLFAAAKPGETFKAIFWNPPWYDKNENNKLDLAKNDSGFAVLKQFLREASDYLKPGGKLFLILPPESMQAVWEKAEEYFDIDLKPLFETTNRGKIGLYTLTPKRSEVRPEGDEEFQGLKFSEELTSQDSYLTEDQRQIFFAIFRFIRKAIQHYSEKEKIPDPFEGFKSPGPLVVFQVLKNADFMRAINSYSGYIEGAEYDSFVSFDTSDEKNPRIILTFNQNDLNPEHFAKLINSLSNILLGDAAEERKTTLDQIAGLQALPPYAEHQAEIYQRNIGYLNAIADYADFLADQGKNPEMYKGLAKQLREQEIVKEEETLREFIRQLRQHDPALMGENAIPFIVGIDTKVVVQWTTSYPGFPSRAAREALKNWPVMSESEVNKIAQGKLDSPVIAVPAGDLKNLVYRRLDLDGVRKFIEENPSAKIRINEWDYRVERGKVIIRNSKTGESAESQNEDLKFFLEMAFQAAIFAAAMGSSVSPAQRSHEFTAQKVEASIKDRLTVTLLRDHSRAIDLQNPSPLAKLSTPKRQALVEAKAAYALAKQRFTGQKNRPLTELPSDDEFYYVQVTQYRSEMRGSRQEESAQNSRQLYVKKVEELERAAGLVDSDQSPATFSEGKEAGKYLATFWQDLLNLPDRLNLNEKDHVLVLGHGGGRVTDYLAMASGAAVDGFEISQPHFEASLKILRGLTSEPPPGWEAARLEKVNLQLGSFEPVLRDPGQLKKYSVISYFTHGSKTQPLIPDLLSKNMDQNTIFAVFDPFAFNNRFGERLKMQVPSEKLREVTELFPGQSRYRFFIRADVNPQELPRLQSIQSFVQSTGASGARTEGGSENPLARSEQRILEEFKKLLGEEEDRLAFAHELGDMADDLVTNLAPALTDETKKNPASPLTEQARRNFIIEKANVLKAFASRVFNSEVDFSKLDPEGGALPKDVMSFLNDVASVFFPYGEPEVKKTDWIIFIPDYESKMPYVVKFFDLMEAYALRSEIREEQGRAEETPGGSVDKARAGYRISESVRLLAESLKISSPELRFALERNFNSPEVGQRKKRKVAGFGSSAIKIAAALYGYQTYPYDSRKYQAFIETVTRKDRLTRYFKKTLDAFLAARKQEKEAQPPSVSSEETLNILFGTLFERGEFSTAQEMLEDYFAKSIPVVEAKNPASTQKIYNMDFWKSSIANEFFVELVPLIQPFVNEENEASERNLKPLFTAIDRQAVGVDPVYEKLGDSIWEWVAQKEALEGLANYRRVNQRVKANGQMNAQFKEFARARGMTEEKVNMLTADLLEGLIAYIFLSAGSDQTEGFRRAEAFGKAVLYTKKKEQLDKTGEELSRSEVREADGFEFLEKFQRIEFDSEFWQGLGERNRSSMITEPSGMYAPGEIPAYKVLGELIYKENFGLREFPAVDLASGANQGPSRGLLSAGAHSAKMLSHNLAEKEINLDGKKIQMTPGDARKLTGFEPDSAGVVVINNGLFFIEASGDDSAAEETFMEAFRILKPGGRFVIRSVYQEAGSSRRSTQDYLEMLKRAGFENLKIAVPDFKAQSLDRQPLVILAEKKTTGRSESRGDDSDSSGSFNKRDQGPSEWLLRLLPGGSRQPQTTVGIFKASWKKLVNRYFNLMTGKVIPREANGTGLDLSADDYEQMVRFLTPEERETYEQYMIQKIAEVISRYRTAGAWHYLYPLSESGTRHDFWDIREPLIGSGGVLEKVQFFDPMQSYDFFIRELVQPHLPSKNMKTGQYHPAVFQKTAQKDPQTAAEEAQKIKLMRNVVETLLQKYINGDIHVQAFLDQGYGEAMLPHSWHRFLLKVNRNYSPETVENLVTVLVTPFFLFPIAALLAFLRLTSGLEGAVKAVEDMIVVNLWRLKINVGDTLIAVLISRKFFKWFLDKYQIWMDALEEQYHKKILANRFNGLDGAKRKRLREEFERKFSRVSAELLKRYGQHPDEQRQIKRMLREVKRVLLDIGNMGGRYVRFIQSAELMFDSEIQMLSPEAVLSAAFTDACNQDRVRFEEITGSWTKKAERHGWARKLEGLKSLIEIQQQDHYRRRYAENKAEREFNLLARSDQTEFRKRTLFHKYHVLSRSSKSSDYHETFVRQFIRELKTKKPEQRRQVLLSYFGGVIPEKMVYLKSGYEKGELANPDYQDRNLLMAQKYGPEILDKIREKTKTEDWGISEGEIEKLKAGLKRHSGDVRRALYDYADSEERTESGSGLDQLPPTRDRRSEVRENGESETEEDPFHFNVKNFQLEEAAQKLAQAKAFPNFSTGVFSGTAENLTLSLGQYRDLHDTLRQQVRLNSRESLRFSLETQGDSPKLARMTIAPFDPKNLDEKGGFEQAVVLGRLFVLVLRKLNYSEEEISKVVVSAPGPYFGLQNTRNIEKSLTELAEGNGGSFQPQGQRSENREQRLEDGRQKGDGRRETGDRRQETGGERVLGRLEVRRNTAESVVNFLRPDSKGEADRSEAREIYEISISDLDGLIAAIEKVLQKRIAELERKESARGRRESRGVTALRGAVELAGALLKKPAGTAGKDSAARKVRFALRLSGKTNGSNFIEAVIKALNENGITAGVLTDENSHELLAKRITRALQTVIQERKLTAREWAGGDSAEESNFAIATALDYAEAVESLNPIFQGLLFNADLKNADPDSQMAGQILFAAFLIKLAIISAEAENQPQPRTAAARAEYLKAELIRAINEVQFFRLGERAFRVDEKGLIRIEGNQLIDALIQEMQARSETRKAA